MRAAQCSTVSINTCKLSKQSPLHGTDDDHHRLAAFGLQGLSRVSKSNPLALDLARFSIQHMEFVKQSAFHFLYTCDWTAVWF